MSIIYRIVATGISILQFFIIKLTKPSKLSYLHGYITSIVVGGIIALMTLDIGGFDSRYYAGLNLVIIGVNLLLPWQAINSAINGLIIMIIYIGLNVFNNQDFTFVYLINNLFFMSATIIIAVSINHVRYLLIKREFNLRSQLKEARAASGYHSVQSKNR